MQLSPTTAGSGAMLLLQPLARAVDLKTSAVHQNMQRSGRWNLIFGPLSGRSPCLRPTAQGGMIGDSERQPHQLQYQFQQAFCLAQPQAKHKAQRQGGLDRQIRIAVLAATGLASWRLPPGQGFRCHPQGQTAALTKSCLILRPVRHPELHLLNMMAAAGIVFERHGYTTKAIAVTACLNPDQ